MPSVVVLSVGVLNFWSGGLPESSNFRMAIWVKSKAPTLFIWGLNQNGQWASKLNLDVAWVC
jgi:hypothetical protein